LVSTGRTLKENNLIELEVLYQSTARLIAHPVSYRVNADDVGAWIDKLRQETMAMA
jgi:ATP phosphoribosyltransferase